MLKKNNFYFLLNLIEKNNLKKMRISKGVGINGNKFRARIKDKRLFK